jgi:uncharacterized repeat protein (TIGR01451 family)
MRRVSQYSAVAGMLFFLVSFPARSNAVDFESPTTYPVGTSPYAIVAGDFSGDGKSDLAVANAGSNNISVLVNNGDGTFKPAVNSPAGTSPQAVAADDFNGDGKLDLVVTNVGDSSKNINGAVFLLLGNGDGTFQAPLQLQADQFPLSLATADLNGDKKPDLLLGDSVKGGVTILLGKGDGSFQPGTTLTLASGGLVAAVAVTDLNADKKADIVAALSSGGVFTILGKGDGSFQAPTQIATTATSPHLIAGDFNGDGKVDLVLRAETPRPPTCRRPPCFAFDRVNLFSGNGDGTFGTGTSVSVQLNISAGNLAAGDFNADSKLDLIIPRFGSGVLVLGHGDGTFLALPPLWTGLGAFVAAAKLNSDNLVDLAVTDVANNAVEVLLNASPTTGADLAVTEPATATVVIGGDDPTFEAKVINQGPQDATGVTVKETLPASFTFVSVQPSQGTCSGTTTITCVLGAMLDLSSATVDFTVHPTVAGIFTDAVQVSATEPDLNSKNDSASMTISALLPADLAISGTASEAVAKIGDNVTFTITVTNHGPATANNVSFGNSLSDQLPVTSVAVSQGTCDSQIICSIGTLASGASATLSFAVTMATAEVFTNSLSVGSDQPDISTDNNNAAITVMVNPAELAVTQTASATSVVTGAPLTLTLAVTNHGPAAANNVMLIESLQGGGTVSSATPSQGSCSAPSGGQITCTLGVLGPSATATVTIPVTFTDAGQWTNSVNISANEPDPDGTNNSASLNIDVSLAPDFTVRPASSSLIVARGSSATDVLTFTSLGGFCSDISLACSVSGSAPLPPCAVSPTTVTPGANPVTATLTLNASALSAGLQPSNGGVFSWPLYAVWLPLPGIALIGIGAASGKSQRRRLVWLACTSILVFVIIAFQAACGGGGSNGSTGTPPQNFAVTVTSTSGAISKSTQIQLTVK